MFCNQCGSEIPAGYSVCPLCNPTVAQPQPAQPPPPAPGPYTGPAPGPGPYAQPPPSGAYPGTYGAPQPNYQPAYAPATNGFAIASLVCSFGGCFLGVPSILAIIFGFVAISQINNSNGTQKGKGLALAGIIIGGIMILLFTLYFISLFILGMTGSIPHPSP